MKKHYVAALATSAVGITATAALALFVNLSAPLTASQLASAPVIQYQGVYDAPPVTAPAPVPSTRPAPRPTTTVAIVAVASHGTSTTVLGIVPPAPAPASIPPTTVAARVTTTTTTAAAVQQAAFSTAGGTVTVACTSASSIRLVSTQPDAGFSAVVANRGPEQVEVNLVSCYSEFQVGAVCSYGQPVRERNGGGE